ncbi:FGGY family carbohydrate kinase [Demequina sp. SYSU T00068]|uniref:xylulokinase n=1 Tax=Demequina lignilytica TaxID=3051663 RepID=UPI0026255C19|nr:FGGY family carbohydrate kinase [Demequina sp. SYSU T00068]MDN4490357.1 FGGY family carbohydrate kinase [Demequina sp. SYSU T00068]
MTLVAGVDSSTQSCKVVVRDLSTGEVVRSGRASHPDGTSVGPAAWWTALLAAIEQAGGLADVAAISVGGQQHGMVALSTDGEVVRDALLWNDTRSAGAARDLTEEFGATALAERTGLVPVASFTSTKLRWLRDAEPDNAARVAAVALPHDWLTWRLRGYGPAASSPLGPVLSELTTDRSDVSGTGYWNPATGEYDRDLLIAALGHDAVVPRVLGAGESAGTVHGDLTGGATCIVGPGAGDNAAAGLGLGATVGDVVVSLGTSGTVFAVTEQGFRDETGIVAGFASASGEYLPLVCTLNASRVLDAFATVLGVGYDELSALAMAAEPGAGGLTLVPYFEGERTPNLPEATASLHGMTLANTTRENIARAAIEGMLAAQAVGMEAILSAGVVAKRALLVGGSAQNAAVQAIAAQVLDVPVEVPEPGEYVAAGAAVQAAWALTGSRPEWPLAVVAAPAKDTRPEIMEAYTAAASSYLP